MAQESAGRVRELGKHSERCREQKLVFFSLSFSLSFFGLGAAKELEWWQGAQSAAGYTTFMPLLSYAMYAPYELRISPDCITAFYSFYLQQQRNPY
jgi:hypothetical protein